MDIVSIGVFVLMGLACWLAYRFIPLLFGGKKNYDRSQFDGKHDRPPERKIDILGR